MVYYGTLFIRQELWIELGLTLTAKIGYEGVLTAFEEVLPKMTPWRKVMVAGTPKIGQV